MQMKPMHSHYKSLAIELIIDGIIMFFFMYAMIDNFSHLYLNTNNLYMTLMMLAPMALIMLFAMRMMYPNKKLNLALYVGFTVVFILSTYGMRAQAFVGDKQFLRAMIPHHAGAILMCQQATITDSEIKSLCQEIVEGQQREISQMQAILNRY
ncbi:MAG: DUF305 domain-containing protein [Rickettsiales bacterium]|nr:DUF305 domain-containing protein [Rickettsiales bacterium]